jgi:hypothetical protein
VHLCVQTYTFYVCMYICLRKLEYAKICIGYMQRNRKTDEEYAKSMKLQQYIQMHIYINLCTNVRVYVYVCVHMFTQISSDKCIPYRLHAAEP